MLLLLLEARAGGWQPCKQPLVAACQRVSAIPQQRACIRCLACCRRRLSCCCGHTRASSAVQLLGWPGAAGIRGRGRLMLAGGRPLAARLPRPVARLLPSISCCSKEASNAVLLLVRASGLPGRWLAAPCST